MVTDRNALLSLRIVAISGLVNGYLLKEHHLQKMCETFLCFFINQIQKERKSPNPQSGLDLFLEQIIPPLLSYYARKSEEVRGLDFSDYIFRSSTTLSDMKFVSCNFNKCIMDGVEVNNVEFHHCGFHKFCLNNTTLNHVKFLTCRDAVHFEIISDSKFQSVRFEDSMIEIEKPKIECVEISGGNDYGKFVIEPLERGFGTTLGNSLRRILLASLPGVAVSSIRIDGVLHEFSTIPGVKEDVTEIILNLKGLCAKLYTDMPKVVTISQQGPKVARAGDIVSDEELERLYATCRVVVVPLRYGAGVKGKVLEALYNGAPVITTSIGAEGIPFVDQALKIEDTAQGFAAATTALYQDPEACRRMSRDTQEYMKKYFSLDSAWETIREDFTV